MACEVIMWVRSGKGGVVVVVEARTPAQGWGGAGEQGWLDSELHISVAGNFAGAYCPCVLTVTAAWKQLANYSRKSRPSTRFNA